MAPPSKLAIRTSSVLRLIKEEASYHKEIAAQEAKIGRMEAAEEDFYDIRKQKEVLTETNKMIPEVQNRLRDAVETLELELENVTEDSVDKTKAEKAVADGKAVYEAKSELVSTDATFTDVS